MKAIYTQDAFRLFELVAGRNLRALNDERTTPEEVFRCSDKILKAMKFYLRAERAAGLNGELRAVDAASLAERMIQSIQTTTHNFAAEQAEQFGPPN